MSASCTLGVGGVAGRRGLSESVLSTAGRNCCNYTARRHSLWDIHTHLRRRDFTTNSLNNIEHTSYRFTFFFIYIEEVEDKHQITKSSLQHLARSWYDGIVFKNGLCASFVGFRTRVCFYSAILILRYSGQTMLKRSVQRRNDRTIISQEQIINDPVIPVVDEASRLLCLLQWYQTFHIVTRISCKFFPSVLGLTCLFLDLFSLQHGCAGRLRPMRCLWIHQD